MKQENTHHTVLHRNGQHSGYILFVFFFPTSVVVFHTTSSAVLARPRRSTRFLCCSQATAMLVKNT